jgi:hypothetical protein
MGRWLQKMHSHIQDYPSRDPIEPQETPFIGSIGPRPIGIQKLRAAEAEFANLDMAPMNVVLCIPHPEHLGHWLAYRRSNRTQQGSGPTQSDAVLTLPDL